MSDEQEVPEGPWPVCLYHTKAGVAFGHDMDEYKSMAANELNHQGWDHDKEEPIMADPPITPTDRQVRDWIWENEGTINPSNGHFACTDCYIRIGQPSSPRGWVAP